jgi:hypothetical protein
LRVLACACPVNPLMVLSGMFSCPTWLFLL